MKNTKVKPKISEVLHLAADKYLAANAHDHYHKNKARFSCGAVLDALNSTRNFKDLRFSDIITGLRKMGCDTTSRELFVKHGDAHPGQFGVNENIQGMRYFWLKWAALMAEEQGQ